MSGNEVVEAEKAPIFDLDQEEAELIRAYMLFSNGDGLRVYNDLMETFYFFESEPFNEELSEIPDPYREYVKAGCRMVMDKIKLINKLAEATR